MSGKVNKKEVSSSIKASIGPTWMWSLPVSALLIKFVIIANIPGYIWLGADGESYLEGVNGLVQDGPFSTAEKLQYFPAGYPLVIWLFSKISITNALLILSIFQSIVFSIAVWYFSRELFKTRFSRYMPWVAFFIAFNPTLSLSSMAIGYESLVASIILITIGMILGIRKEQKNLYKKIVLFSFLSSFMAFLQPRYLATTAILLFVWLLINFSKKELLKFISIGLVVLMLFPIGLALRNQQATGKFFISNNLGVTMNVGAGPESTGGYTNKATGVKCVPEPKTDNQRVVCVLKWYASNPLQIFRLSYNKTLYFFSPWSGPLANGTMARNPWLKINPVSQIAKTPDGFNTVYGGIGKTLSWIWFLAQISLMAWGAVWLWRQGEDLRRVAIVAGTTIGISWAVSAGTIGDHRFRLPVMGLILLFQVAGVRGLSRQPLILKPTSKRR